MAKGKYERWLTEEGLLLIEGWARDGLTDEQIAHNMGIRRETLYDWCKKFPNISNTLKKGKEVVDIMVENALLKSALGHTAKIKKAIKVKTEKQKVGEGKIVEEHIEYADEEIYVPPQTLAQIFWLKNRKPSRWRDKPLEEQEQYEDDGLIAALASTNELVDDNDMIGDEDNEESNIPMESEDVT